MFSDFVNSDNFQVAKLPVWVIGLRLELMIK